MKVIAFDTETTGFTRAGVPSDHPSQPRIVQLGAVVYDTEADEVVAKFDKLIKPDGWTIGEGAAKVHGISQARAEAEGEPHREVLQSFIDLWRECDYRIAYNESFDRKMVRIHLKCYFAKELADEWLVGLESCMMHAATPICAMPPTEKQRRAFPDKRFKNPKLSEAVQILLERDHEGAHGALADAMATMDIWRLLRNRGMLPAPRRLELKHDDGLAEERERQHDAVRRGRDIISPGYSDPFAGSELF